MNRKLAVQRVIDKLGARTYLEIGVFTGRAFLPMRARRKIAVDPSFKIEKWWRLLWAFRNRRSEFHSLTSDAFFQEVGVPGGADVVLVDGLHTYEQSLRDVENSLELLNPGGVIVMHDCNPATSAIGHPAQSHAHAATLNIPGWSGEWCGDVWKTICYLRSQRSDVRVFVMDCDYGIGVVTRGIPDDRLDLSKADIDHLTYNDLAKDRRRLLNLKDPSYYSEFLKTLS